MRKFLLAAAIVALAGRCSDAGRPAIAEARGQVQPNVHIVRRLGHSGLTCASLTQTYSTWSLPVDGDRRVPLHLVKASGQEKRNPCLTVNKSNW